MQTVMLLSKDIHVLEDQLLVLQSAHNNVEIVTSQFLSIVTMETIIVWMVAVMYA